jgi:alpha-ketoglutaric semialdehyde dehydrogenase
MLTGRNYIAGEWRDGAGWTEDVSPYDANDIVGRFAQAATAFRRASRSGCVMVDPPTAGTDYHAPFGGVRGSSYGPREQGRAAVEFYTQIKTSYLHAGAPE